MSNTYCVDNPDSLFLTAWILRLSCSPGECKKKASLQKEVRGIWTHQGHPRAASLLLTFIPRLPRATPLSLACIPKTPQATLLFVPCIPWAFWVTSLMIAFVYIEFLFYFTFQKASGKECLEIKKFNKGKDGQTLRRLVIYLFFQKRIK